MNNLIFDFSSRFRTDGQRRCLRMGALSFRLLALAFLLGDIGCTTTGTLPPISPQEIAGTWIGEDPVLGIRFELRLDHNCAGILGVMFFDQEPEITTIQGLVRCTPASLTLAVGPYPNNKPGPPTLDLRPFVGGGMLLQFTGDGVTHSWVVYRESIVEDRNARLKRAMDAVQNALNLGNQLPHEK